MSDENVLKHIVCYDALPGDFDPSTAEARVLRKHGIPRPTGCRKRAALEENMGQRLSNEMQEIEATPKKDLSFPIVTLMLV